MVIEGKGEYLRLFMSVNEGVDFSLKGQIEMYSSYCICCLISRSSRSSSSSIFFLLAVVVAVVVVEVVVFSCV